MRQRLTILCSLTLATACSSNPNVSLPDDAGAREAAPTTDGSSPDASVPTDAAADGSTACNAIANVAPAVAVTEEASDPPSGSGGLIADGTYALTSAVIYTGPQGPTGALGTGRTTIKISAGTLEVTTTGQPATRTVSLVTSGTTFTATDTCPDTNVMTGSYTANPTTLVIILPAGTEDAGPKTLVETFTKQ